MELTMVKLNMAKKTIVGIIGGTGQMGQFFKNFFEKNGCEVLIAGRKTKISIEECTKKSDVVIISVPINKTIEVIRKIGPIVRDGCVLMDLTSIKVQPVESMLECAGKNVEVIGTHPVFGPNVSSIKNQTVVLVPARGSKWIEWLKGILEKGGAKIKLSTAEEHDKMMAVIQCMTHFSTIAGAHAIKDRGFDIKESLDYTSPIYKIRMGMFGRILNQDPMLYADIETMNKYALEAIDSYIKTAKELREIIQQKDINSFLGYFNEAADFFGDYKKTATEESDYLIEKLAKRKNIKGDSNLLNERNK